MKTQVTTIATTYYTSAIDVFDVEKMLNVTFLPPEHESIYVTIVVLHRHNWEQKAYEISGDLYVTLVIDPSELLFQDIAVLTKDKLRSYLEEVVIEKRELEMESML